MGIFVLAALPAFVVQDSVCAQSGSRVAWGARAVSLVVTLMLGAVLAFGFSRGAKADAFSNTPPASGASLILPPGATTALPLGDLLGTEYNLRAFGAKGDGITLSDITTTASSPVIGSNSYTFSKRDEGKYITILGAGSSATAPFNATIQSTSGGQATMSATASRSIAGTGVATFGTDDTAKIQAAVNYASVAGGGRLFAPAGVYIITYPVTWKSKVSMRGLGAGKSVIKWISTTDTSAAMISGLSGSSGATYLDVAFSDLEFDADAATAASYNVAAKILYFQYMIRPVIERLYVHGSLATAIGIDFLKDGIIVNNVVTNAGRLCITGNPGGSGIGIGTEGDGFSDGSTITGNIVHSPNANFGNYGIFVEAQHAKSTVSFNRIADNIVYLNGEAQRGIGVSGVLNTLVSNNQIIGSGKIYQRGISIDLGTVGTIITPDTYGKTIGNIIKNVDTGIFYDGTTASSTYQPGFYTFENNTISGSMRYGYWLSSGSSVVLDGMTINGGVVSGSGGAGVYLDGAAGFKDLTVNNLKAFNNGLTTATAERQAALSISAPVNRLTMHGNDFFDGGAGKQLYALIVNGVAVTSADIGGNNLSGNATGAVQLTGGGTLDGWAVSNKGYNPLGPASVTPGASPWTYTAGITPETLYLTGGTVSAVAKSGTTLATASPAAVSLQPGESVTVTYTVAPTAVADRR